MIYDIIEIILYFNAIAENDDSASAVDATKAAIAN